MRGELRKREGSIQWLTASFSTQCRLLCGTNTTVYFLLAVLREEDLEKNYLFHFLAVHTHTHTTHAWTNTTDTRTHVQKIKIKNSHTHARTRAPNRLNDFLHQLYPRLNKEVELRCLRGRRTILYTPCSFRNGTSAMSPIGPISVSSQTMTYVHVRIGASSLMIITVCCCMD